MTMSNKNIEDIYLLSPLQEGLLFHALYTAEADPYLQQIRFSIRGDFDLQAFQGAWEKIIERHTIVGEQILAPVEFLAGVRTLVRHEHERWDGHGYPDKLAGESIPLGSRIILACDALHAMTSDRPYRAALSLEDAVAELRRHAGTQFDPRVVRALLAVLDESPMPALMDT